MIAQTVVKATDRDVPRRHRRDIIERMWFAFKERGWKVVIPFPEHDARWSIAMNALECANQYFRTGGGSMKDVPGWN